MATRTDIEAGWYTGADMVLSIPVVDASDPPAPENMDGWTLGFVIRVKQSDGAGQMLIGITTDDGGITVVDGEGTNDVAMVNLPQSAYQAALSENRTYEYALWRLDSPSIQPLKFGDLYVTAVASW